MVVGGENGSLMTTLTKLANFTQPQSVAETHPAFGQLHGDDLTTDERYRLVVEFIFRPSCLGILVIGQTGYLFCAQTCKEIGAVAFAVEDQNKPMPRPTRSRQSFSKRGVH